MSPPDVPALWSIRRPIRSRRIATGSGARGCRSQVPAGSLVQGGRSVFPGTADAEIYFYRGDYAPLADRLDPYGRRIFRDPHPLDDLPVPVWDNGNGFRFLIGALGVKAVADDERLLLTPANTNDVLTNEPAGGVFYGLQQVPRCRSPNSRPSTPVPIRRSTAHPRQPIRGSPGPSSTYNIENLYDYRDDPHDGCDFVGNTGCTGVTPPFDYVPGSAAEYDAQLTDLATQIIEDLKAPDLIMTQEGGDQDICAVVAFGLTCGTTDDRRRQAGHAPGAGPAHRRRSVGRSTTRHPTGDGADDREIVSGFLYRTDRVQLLPVGADRSDPEHCDRRRLRGRGPSGTTPTSKIPRRSTPSRPADDARWFDHPTGPFVYTRPPQVGHFRVWRDGIGTSVLSTSGRVQPLQLDPRRPRLPAHRAGGLPGRHRRCHPGRRS